VNQETQKSENPTGITITATRDGWEPIEEHYEDNEAAMRRLTELRNQHIKELSALREARKESRHKVVFEPNTYEGRPTVALPEPKLEVNIVVR
jgi:hypothetical protein